MPKIVLTVNHASGAGYYAMAGQGFDPDFILSWPTGRMAVMEGESAVTAVHGPEIEKARQAGAEPSAAVQASVESMRADYEHQLDARFAAARGYVDAIVTPEETRDQLAFLLRTVANYAGPHLGPFVLPPLDSVTPTLMQTRSILARGRARARLRARRPAAPAQHRSRPHRGPGGRPPRRQRPGGLGAGGAGRCRLRAGAGCRSRPPA